MGNFWFLLWQILWTFSIYLEAVAILPQLVLLQRSRNIDNLTGNYVFLLGYAIHVYQISSFSLIILIVPFLFGRVAIIYSMYTLLFLGMSSVSGWLEVVIFSSFSDTWIHIQSQITFSTFKIVFSFLSVWDLWLVVKFVDCLLSNLFMFFFN